MGRPKKNVVVQEKEMPTFHEDDLLPKKSLFRVDEAADYFQITNRCIYRWIEHGILQAEKIQGCVRIPRKSILACRFNRPQ